jgi:hypothetical protein
VRPAQTAGGEQNNIIAKAGARQGRGKRSEVRLQR